MKDPLFAVSVMRNFGPSLDPSAVEAEPLDTSTLPVAVKAGFRNRFWNVFSEGWRVPVTGTIRLFGHELTVDECLWFRSTADRMNKLYGENHVLVLQLSPATGHPRDVAAAIKSNAPVLEQQILTELQAANSAAPIAALISLVDHGENKPSFKFYCPDETTSAVDGVQAYLLAFYHMAIVTLYRIERHQWSVPVTTDVESLDYDSMQDIALSRAMLLGFDRDFMTLNKSEVPEVLDACRLIDGDLRLREQFQREVSLNASLEQHLNNVTQVSQARSSATSGQALTVLAVLGVPLSIVGTVLSYWGFQQPNGPLYGSPLMWGLVAISVGIPIAVFGLVGIWARMRSQRNVARSTR